MYPRASATLVFQATPTAVKIVIFAIRQGNRIHEIGVDGHTGKIVEDKFEALGDKD